MKASCYSIKNPVHGVLIGTAVGDALGLPAEGLSPKRIKANGWNQWDHRLLFGKGMVSDDTEHTLFVSQAMLQHPDDPDAFRRALGWKLRWWLVSCPAGVGLATARAIFKLWFGIPVCRSGVWSAGNGPAMRSAIIGVRYCDDLYALRACVKASTCLTHTDPRALTGALAVAEICAYFANGNDLSAKTELFLILKELQPVDDEWLRIIAEMEQSVECGHSVADFCLTQGLTRGVSGYIYHTVPVAVYACLRHEGDFEASMSSLLSCGGDTDTSGAILGAMLGALGQNVSIPKPWVDGICDWPRSVRLLEEVARRFAANPAAPASPVRYSLLAVIPRNIVFLCVVLFHGMARMLPAFCVRRMF